MVRKNKRTLSGNLIIRAVDSHISSVELDFVTESREIHRRKHSGEQNP